MSAIKNIFVTPSKEVSKERVFDERVYKREICKAALCFPHAIKKLIEQDWFDEQIIKEACFWRDFDDDTVEKKLFAASFLYKRPKECSAILRAMCTHLMRKQLLNIGASRKLVNIQFYFVGGKK